MMSDPLGLETFLTWFAIAMAVLAVIAFAMEYWPEPRDPAKLAFKREQDWERMRRAQGASRDEIEHERKIRVALATLRREASDGARRNPKEFEKEIEKAIESGYRDLAYFDATAAKHFASIVKELDDFQDILYPDAVAVVSRANGYDEIVADVELPPSFYQDRIAAFTDLK